MSFGAGSQTSGSGHALRLRSRPNIPRASSTGWQPLVNEKDPSGVSTIVHNQPAHRLACVDSLGDGSMPLPLRVPPNSVTDSDVARKVLPRDRTSAVVALFEEQYASLVRMARLLVDDRETAEDVVMDAFTSLYRRWTAVRDPAEAHRYLRSCVLNGARSQLRRRRLRRRHESGSLHQEATRDGRETNEADRSTVTQLLWTLPYRQRQVLVLRYFVDLTEAQIAYELGVSPGSVKTHASRGLAALARALDGSR
jgi:RNA polymerase sigma-70 factor (sigma-E family)